MNHHTDERPAHRPGHPPADSPPESRASTAATPSADASSGARARAAAEAVVDPELPMLTLADLGVLRAVTVDPDGAVTAALTPTYSGCPAVAEMRAALDAGLRAAGFADVRVRTVLDPPWSSDWITAEGRRKLTDHGIAPPGPAAVRSAGGPVPLTLHPSRDALPVHCPNCGSADTQEISRFSATACTALRRCRACREPFDQVKDV